MYRKLTSMLQPYSLYNRAKIAHFYYIFSVDGFDLRIHLSYLHFKYVAESAGAYLMEMSYYTSFFYHSPFSHAYTNVSTTTIDRTGKLSEVQLIRQLVKTRKMQLVSLSTYMFLSFLRWTKGLFCKIRNFITGSTIQMMNNVQMMMYLLTYLNDDVKLTSITLTKPIMVQKWFTRASSFCILEIL